ncbi:MAG TPA: RNA 2',3'-cyclic phosphodiesterase [Gemmatimonadales bacterium]|nr:RNA 2',3'-cyclic phosphodiesterase [Gemmatimonadales bacterium]
MNFPERVRRELWDALAPLRQRREKLPVTWVRPENIHLSLKFLGEVEDARASELQAALRRAAGGGSGAAPPPTPRPLAIQITGFGVFPDYHRPRVLWAGVTPEPGLELLQHGVEQAFAPLGFPTEARAFRPHVTVGRAARDAKPRQFAGLEELLAGVDFNETVSVADLDLMQSTLRPEGSVYHVRYHERLS